MEDCTEIEVVAKVPEIVEPEKEKLPEVKKDLRDEIREILAVSFVCESNVLRKGAATLPIAECMEVYRKNPFVFYYINKQVDHVMRAIRRHAVKQS